MSLNNLKKWILKSVFYFWKLMKSLIIGYKFMVYIYLLINMFLHAEEEEASKRLNVWIVNKLGWGLLIASSKYMFNSNNQSRRG